MRGGADAGGGGERGARRIFLLLLHLYPPPFRARHGEAMVATLLEAWRARPGSLHGKMAFWLRTAGELTSQGLAERLRPAPVDPRKPGDPRGGEGPIAGWLTDVRTALRSLRASPRFTLLVILTLALGIGANVGVLTLVDIVLLRPLPVREPDRLVEVFEALDEGSPRGGLAYVTYGELAERSAGVDGMAAFAQTESELRMDGGSVLVQVGLVSGEYFEVLGVDAWRGRTIVPDDVRGWGSVPVTVISYDLWRDELSGREGIVGSTLRLGERSFTVVGIAPPRFRGVHLTSAIDLWIPATMGAAVAGEGGLYSIPEVLTERFARLFDVVARLDGAVTLEAATRSLNDARLTLAHDVGEGVSHPISVVPLRQAAALADRDDLVRFLLLLSGVVGLTLLIAAMNVTNLLLVRFRRRGRELAVRSALGAGRGRLFRELTAEAVVLGAGGAAVSLLAARAVIVLIRGFSLPGGVRVADVSIDMGGSTIVLAGILGSVSALAFGTFSAWRATRWHLMDDLRTSRAVDPGRRDGWGVLLAAQSGLSVVLLVGATLFARTLQEALRIDLGFEPEGVGALSVPLRAHGVTGEEAPALVDEVLRRVRARGDVESAAYASHVPVSSRSVALPFVVEGEESVPGAVPVNVVTPEYFDVLRIPVVEGRTFDEGDGPDTEPVIVVNEAAARLLWPEGRSVGQRARITFARDLSTVIGVVGQTLYHDLTTRDEPYVYYLVDQMPGPALSEGSFLARGVRGSAEGVAALRDVLPDVDPDLPVHGGRSVADQLDEILATQRFGAILLTLLSVLAVVVAAVGVYGVASWSVASRRREIGIRMALGAPARVVVSDVLGRAGLAMAFGTLVGVLVAVDLSGLLETFLLRVGPLDLAAFAGALGAMGFAGAAAMLLPARRAVSVDPAVTMKSE